MRVLPLVVTLALAGLPGAEPAEGRPNVVFVVVDDLNDWTGFLGGHPQARTPHMDRLAARGTVFTRAYCAAPACNPSRVSVLTGRRPSSTGVYHNTQPWRPVLPDAVTLPQYFAAAGYRVEGGGKIDHGGFEDAASWQEYFPRPEDPVPQKRWSGIRSGGDFDWGPVPVDDAAMGDHRVVDWAIERLRRRDERPLFLAVGLYRPHLPWYVPAEHFDPRLEDDVRLPVCRADDLDDVPPRGREIARARDDHANVLAAGQWHDAVRGYLASIAFADAQVGRLLDALDASPLAEDTLVVLWGDHGWHLGEKEHWRKFALWENTTRTPLIVAGPGVAAGARCDRPVSLLDLYPTLADLCGLPPSDEVEGASLRPLLTDAAAPWERPAVTTYGRNNHAVRTERWRYVRYDDGSEELYDHAADPHEWTNLAAQPEHAAVRAELAQWLPTVNAPEAPVKKGPGFGGRGRKTR